MTVTVPSWVLLTAGFVVAFVVLVLAIIGAVTVWSFYGPGRYGR